MNSRFALPVLAATAVVWASGTGSAKAACVVASDFNITITCTGAFPSDPNNAAFAANALYPFDNTLIVDLLTADIVPDPGNPGVSLIGIATSGASPGPEFLFDGDPGGNGETGRFVTVGYSAASGNPSAFAIRTTGNSTAADVIASGVVAISRGGDGGRGGSSFDAIGVGGRGGNAGSGGRVELTARDGIFTAGAFAHGILAQSLGGNGGDGGNGFGFSGKGGTGGNAASGDEVHVRSFSNITTRGNSAYGIFAQSAGGHGGAGGDGAGIVGKGGPGGTTANGGLVRVENTGNIITQGVAAYGIFAQSIGGFGGNGGLGGGLVGFGSSGASAGDGGEVRLTNSGAIFTASDDSHAIFAESVGGGGGSGGLAGGLVGLGASGAIGGAGGLVTVTTSGTNFIQTIGARSAGIFAQSLGGGGGDGGASLGLVSLGGTGSTTSPGGAVTVINSQGIVTAGARSQAIFAQSLGGGGGDGGLALGLITIGGGGGGGGNGANVAVTNSGYLQTSGNEAVGLQAQSMGGGGGDGGGTFALGPGFSMAIGGSGALGGNAGQVVVNDTLNPVALAAADINTAGFKSHGIFAQSVGGGGGNGGFSFSGSSLGAASAAIAVGGSGGPGGAGSTVTVNQHGNISTQGAEAIGIFAQSVGGGGGYGGGRVAATLTAGYSVTFGLGSTGGAGGNASAVAVNHVGGISTSQALSDGIFAQSVGGGGGRGGFSVAAGLGSIGASAAVGGNGGGGGLGNNVTVQTLRDATGSGYTIATSGDLANGILAQSVGGGGGTGGFAGALAISDSGVGGSVGGSWGGRGGDGGGAGGVATVNNVNDIQTLGAEANGIVAQSVGGGGGSGGFSITAGGGGGRSLSVALGGSGGNGGNGSRVNLINEGRITTAGDASYGILAQSVGGGGGKGGFAFGLATGMQLASTPGLAGTVTVGGSGGGGGDGGLATLSNRGSIATSGVNAHALLAQSVGKGGGTGGWAGSVAITTGTGGTLGFALGGSGGGGGNGGTVQLSNLGSGSGTIRTSGNGASGLFAQSIGGGGGDAGFGFAGAFGFSSGEKNVNAAVSIGGSGGVGGRSGGVSVSNNFQVTTGGDDAHGIFAQSLGGGGGDGGFAISGTLSLAGPTPGSKVFPVGVSVGGDGGTGNTSAGVTASNTAAITTSGRESRGIFAQSVGGGGGNGGLAVTAQLTGAVTNAATVGFALGGDGGTGNTAGVVIVSNQTAGATINTAGFGAHGIQAQSIGGGGGNAALAIVALLGKAGGSAAEASKTLNIAGSVGGDGGSGGVGGQVSVTNQATIRVSGATATGIYAQSVGGGGGDGGAAVTGIGLLTDTSNDSSRAINLTGTIGGKGGEGNGGGKVIIRNDGNITTEGGNGYGIFAQSIGHGGGSGGRANTLALPIAKDCTLPVFCDAPPSISNNWSAAYTVGGDSGGSSSSELVTIFGAGAIETFGDTADGIHAQSIGGGGGDGGNGVIGSDGLLPIPAELAVTPFGAVGTLKNLTLTVGGDQGASGNGAAVFVAQSKGITTHGTNSAGIFAQSLGGGGGVGGKAVVGAAGTVGLGGRGGAAGNGGTVHVDTLPGINAPTPTIETFGTASAGIFAQSLGGGGGQAGNVDRMLATPALGGLIPKWNVGVGLAVGLGGGAGGNGAAVEVLTAGQVITHGNSAIGILAQSVGGGGGVLGELGNNARGLERLSWAMGSNGDAGNGGNVSVDANGDVRTAGNYATGIFAQSAGGVGVSGAVNVTVRDNRSIRTAEILDATPGGSDLDAAGHAIRGLGAVGIMAQSVANADNNANSGNINISIGTGATVRGGRSDGSATGVGIAVLDGKDNTITNRGTITTADGVDRGFAILGAGSRAEIDPQAPQLSRFFGGNETVRNFGTITGSVNLDQGTDAFLNQAGGTLNSGSAVVLGTGELFTNSGSFLIGGASNVLSTNLTGDLLQTATGDLGFDVFGIGAGEFDELFVSGGLNLAGGTATFNFASDLTFDLFAENLSIFDFIVQAAPLGRSTFSDPSLFANLKFIGRTSTGSFDILLANDGSFSAVPAPGTLLLLGTGLALVGFSARRRAARLAAQVQHESAAC